MSKKDFMLPPGINQGNTSDGVLPSRQSITSALPSPIPQTNTTSATDSKFKHDGPVATKNGNEYSLQFEPNILDDYDVCTYHWKLFITSTETANSGKVLDLSNQTIIAESGVSDLTIDKVEMNGIAVPTIESGTGTSTTVRFEITEPAGASLLDKIYYEALSLGIGNWLVMPFFIQLEFRVRDPLTSDSSKILNGSGVESQRWVWPIKITTVKANVTQVGTRYNFDAIVYNELGQSNAYSSIQHNVVIRDITTFGSAMAALEKKLNDDQYEKLIDIYSIPDKYKIVVDPSLANLNIVLPSSNKDTSRGASFTTLDKKTASFNAGTGIDKIIDSLLGNTDYFQKKIQGSKTRTGTPDSSTELPDQMKKLWRIVTESIPIKFDPLRDDNAVQVTIFITEYDIGVLDATPAQMGQTPTTDNQGKKRFKEYVQKKILKKRYDYIFTGLNTQVKSFDLTLNFAHATIMSRFNGVYLDSAVSDTGMIKQKSIDTAKKAADTVRKTLQFANDAGAADQKKVTSEINNAKTSIANDNSLDAATKARYTVLLDHARSKDRLSFTNQVTASGGLNNNGSLSAAASSAKSLAASNTNVKLLSNTTISSSEKAQLASKSANNRASKLRPVAFREGVQETNLAYGIDPTSDAGRSRTSSLFSTALYSSMDANLQSIKMTVRGDPFWLFPQPISKDSTSIPRLSIDKIKKSHIDVPNSANLFGTDNFIIVRFRTPRLFDDTNSGPIDPFTEVEMLTGVYRVISIVNKFESGSFSQELSCQLDPVINLSDFLNDVEAVTAKPTKIPKQVTTTLSSQDGTILNPNSITQSVLPPNSIKLPSKIATPTLPKGVSDVKSKIASTSSQVQSNIPTIVYDDLGNVIRGS